MQKQYFMQFNVTKKTFDSQHHHEAWEKCICPFKWNYFAKKITKAHEHLFILASKEWWIHFKSTKLNVKFVCSILEPKLKLVIV